MRHQCIVAHKPVKPCS